jgi:hypothetical protein
MSESTSDSAPGDPVPAAASDGLHEDDRRQKAAAANRKKIEEQWLRNKQSWIQENFPDKRPPG